MSNDKKKNAWYWLGNLFVGIAGVAVTYSDKIQPKVFPDQTIVNQLAIPISVGLKFLWDSWKYRKGTIAEHGKKIYDKIPNKVTGKYNELPSGLGE